MENKKMELKNDKEHKKIKAIFANYLFNNSKNINKIYLEDIKLTQIKKDAS